MNPVMIFILIPIMIGMGWLFVFVSRKPVWAAYLFLATQPFIGGIERGKLIPLLRPSEAFQFFLMGAVLAGALYRAAQGERLSFRFTRLDRAILAVCVLSSIWPLCWMFARGQFPTSSDIFSTVVLWRLAALYAIFRWVVRTPEQTRRCLWTLLISATVLALLAIAGSLGIFKPGGPWTPTIIDVSTGRGGATLNSSIAVGDYLGYSFAVAAVWILRRRSPLPVIAAIGGIIMLGILGTGQFSAWFELIIVVFVVAVSEGQVRQLMKWLAPVSIVGAVIAWPVISTRLAGFGGSEGLLPHSWQGRIDNLTNFYVPRMGGFKWVLGVRPDTVLKAPEAWRVDIYLESGYLWLFWVGGIPLVLAFLWMLRRGFRLTRQVASTRADDVGVAAVAARAALWSLLVLSLIDPHLTLRGGADLLFCLLGLAANLNVPPTHPDKPDLAPPDLQVVRALPSGRSDIRLS